jgi:hypothetical protein
MQHPSAAFLATFRFWSRSFRRTASKAVAYAWGGEMTQYGVVSEILGERVSRAVASPFRIRI